MQLAGKCDPIWKQVIIIKKTATAWFGRLGKSGQKGKSQKELRKGKTIFEKTHGETLDKALQPKIRQFI